MSRIESVAERKASIARARASGHSGIPRAKENPQFEPSTIYTGIDFAAWLDGSAAGKSIWEIAAVCGSLDAAYDYTSTLGTNLILTGGNYRIARGCKRATLANPPRSNA